MNTKYFGRDDRCDGEAVENVDERFPCLDIAPSFAFIVEAVNYSEM